MSSRPNRVALAIAGGDSLVGQTLEHMLRGAGYYARFLDVSSINDPSDPLKGASLVLLAPRMSGADRDAFLGHLRNRVPRKATVPVLELVGNGGTENGEAVGVRRVLWPCRLKVLLWEIENALLNDALSPPAVR